MKSHSISLLHTHLSCVNQSPRTVSMRLSRWFESPARCWKSRTCHGHAVHLPHASPPAVKWKTSARFSRYNPVSLVCPCGNNSLSYILITFKISSPSHCSQRETTSNSEAISARESSVTPPKLSSWDTIQQIMSRFAFMGLCENNNRF